MRNIISLTPEKVEDFLDRAIRARPIGIYTRISRRDFCTLSPTLFLVYSLVRSLANFRTKVVDFSRQARYLRSQYHKKTISRNLIRLERRGLVARVARRSYRLYHDRRGRPINLSFVYLVTDPESALLARFVLLLAFWRGSWRELTTRRIREVLGIDYHSAVALGAALRAREGSLSKRTIRAVVFYSRRPNYWQCRPGYRKDPDTDYCYDFVRAEPPLLICSRLSNQYAPGAPPGTRPGSPGRQATSVMETPRDQIAPARAISPSRCPVAREIPSNVIRTRDFVADLPIFNEISTALACQNIERKRESGKEHNTDTQPTTANQRFIPRIA